LPFRFSNKARLRVRPKVFSCEEPAIWMVHPALDKTSRPFYI
jgi:hypothetical protein